VGINYIKYLGGKLKMEEILTNIISATLAILIMFVIYLLYMSASKVSRIKRDITYSDNVAGMLRDKLIKISKEQSTYMKLYQNEIKKLNENLYTLHVTIKNLSTVDSKFETPFNLDELAKNAMDIEDTVIKEELQNKEINFYEVYDKAVEEANRIKEEIENTKVEFEPDDINFLNPKFKRQPTKVKYDDIDNQYIPIDEMYKIMNGG